ncbi:DNA-directed RNA polymerase sigma-70 factor [Agaricicola taiwanensis]|uniref:DNA-directed RNA polymerase sigma-70 factor n=1 Tax=Agaricicola taiwanensis TaxID=591372 RepID=A0A8J3DYF0_9RHOB|nr:sigma-70 family RNA polymerase sigma factor [Agaricicola taiwanensis]GGE50039.1 DNA-directed RNA polymerase sigma-70 factor [Agaricicola taiwanensis]
MPQADDRTEVFEQHRARLVRLAYRMLGSRAEAEDIVQNAWLRWVSADRSGVSAPSAFLARTVARLCLDEMKSARARRETYVGAWLPEPLIETEDERVDEDDLTLTLMMALERLSPLERAAFLLHDVFGVALDEVAVTLKRQPSSVRQLAVRARKHVQTARSRFPVEREEGERIARAFFAASTSGDVATLRTLLAENVVLQADGGGKVTAYRNPIVGVERLLRLFDSLRQKWGDGWATMIEPVWIDALPGYISKERGEVLQTTAFAIENGRITGIYVTRNPDKLSHIARALAAEPDGMRRQ